MEVVTKEYRLDAATFRRSAYRTYWRLLWRQSVSSTICAIAMLTLGYPWVAALFLVLAISMPFLIAAQRAHRALSSPLNSLPYVMRFTDDCLEQLSGGERRMLVRYEELAYFDEIPEGIRVWVTNKGAWFLIPREAFTSPGGFAEACALLVRVGKMRTQSRPLFF